MSRALTTEETVVGLTGGIASGKSTVSSLIKANDIPLIDLDILARRAVEPQSRALKQIKQHFGEAVINVSDGSLNRDRLGQIVFNDDKQRKKLNGIVHPAVRRLLAWELAKCWLKGYKVAVVDAPLLIEAGLWRFCGAIVVVYCSENLQLQRLQSRNNLSATDARSRIAAQAPLSSKLTYADYVIDNSGSRRDLDNQVLTVVNKLDKRAGKWTWIVYRLWHASADIHPTVTLFVPPDVQGFDDEHSCSSCQLPRGQRRMTHVRRRSSTNVNMSPSSSLAAAGQQNTTTHEKTDAKISHHFHIRQSSSCSVPIKYVHDDDGHDVDEKMELSPRPRWLNTMVNQHEQAARHDRKNKRIYTAILFVASILLVLVALTRTIVGSESVHRWRSTISLTSSRATDQLNMDEKGMTLTHHEHALTLKQAHQLWDGQVLTTVDDDGAEAADFDESDADAHATTSLSGQHESMADNIGDTNARGCGLASRELVANARSWIVREISKRTYLIQLRDHVHVPIACSLDAVFAVRLVHGHAPNPDDLDAYETIFSVSSQPILVSDRSGFTFNLTVADQVLPEAQYDVQVDLEFGSLPGARDGQVCGYDELQCDVDRVADSIGREATFVGARVEFEHIERGQVWLGQRKTEDGLLDRIELCRDLSDVQGYWTGLVYNVVDRNGRPCRLANRQDPFSDDDDAKNPSGEDNTSISSPLWLHFVGDSNTRNAFTALLDGLGPGPYGSNVVHDSAKHNGSVATVAYRSLWRRRQRLDVVLTWSWWHHQALSPDNDDDDRPWDAAVLDNAAQLYDLTLSDMTLARFCSSNNLETMLDPVTVGTEFGSSTSSSSDSLMELAQTKTPDFIFVSLGSHAPEITSFGQSSSFDLLFSDDWWQRVRQQGDNSDLTATTKWRFMSVSDVNPKYIPLDRWPRQDLVRNNPVIRAKNQELKTSVSKLWHKMYQRLDVRVVDVASLTHGLGSNGGGESQSGHDDSSSQWMKVNHKTGKVDALHFRHRVYREWSRDGRHSRGDQEQDVANERRRRRHESSGRRDDDIGDRDEDRHRHEHRRRAHAHVDDDDDDGGGRYKSSSKRHKQHSRQTKDADKDEDEWVEKAAPAAATSVAATLLAQQSERAPVDSYGTFSVDDLRRERDGRLARLDSASEFTDGYANETQAESTTLGDLFGNMGQVRQRQPRPDSKPDPAATMGQSSRELNKQYWQGTPATATAATTRNTTTATASSPAPGSSGSAWRMSKLRRTYEMAQEEGRPVEDVALERYGSLDLFRQAQDERRILDERQDNKRPRRQDGLGPSTPAQDTGRRFMFTDAGTGGGGGVPGSADSSRPASRGSFRRPGEQQPPPSLHRSISNASSSNGGGGTTSTAAGGTPSTNQHSRPQTPIPSVFTPPPVAPKRTQSGLSTSMVLVPDPTSSSTSNSKPPLTQSELNKLQAKVLKAKLMGLDNATELEQEYERERKRRDEAGPEVLEANVDGDGGHVRVLPTLDGRGRLYDVGTGKDDSSAAEDKTQSGRRKKKEPFFESRDRKTGEVLRHNADDDQISLSELVRQEKFSAGASDQKNMDYEMANRIATDARFDNDLDYIDENAERLARRKMKSDVMKKAFAIQDYAKTKKALDNCNMCTGDEGQPPRSAVVAMGTRAYLGLLENEELVPGHCRIVPIQHHFTSLDADDDTWDEIKNFMKTLMQMNASEHDKGVIFFESCINLKHQRHTSIECIPVPFDLFDELPSYFKASLLTNRRGLCALTDMMLPDTASQEAIDTSEQEWSQHKKRIDFRSDRPFRRSMVPNLPYFMVQFDYKGEKGFGHVIEGVDDAPEHDHDGQELRGELGEQGSGQFPKWFAQEIVGNLMDLEPRKWRKPKRVDFRHNKERVDKFRKVYNKYDWTTMIGK
ncbi:Pre-mRNA-splicing factor cwf19 [Microbotryomycetes sp. JL201]|nr:Pre-mRNA-splicing factor cwf19 [Microbotryomycetes sp. JL201]